MRITKIIHRLLTPPRSKPAKLEFYCNICGWPSQVIIANLGREISTCATCGSTVRARSLIHLLSMALFGESMAIHEFPVQRDISVLDMSGWEEYGRRLRTKIEYLNTYFHQEPYLDITAITPSWEGLFDVVISSDVFEHIAPPVSVAFENARKMLKPGGILILTVPYTKEEETHEHFMELYRYEVVKMNGLYRLHNTTADGREQWFDDLIFHGGPGSTLEMRVFSEKGLLSELASAGFSNIHVCRESAFDVGVIALDNWSLPVTARNAE